MRRRLGGEAASSTTELVLLMPAALLAIMVVVQVALYFHAMHVVEAAAHEALESAQVELGDAASGMHRGEQFLSEAGGIRDATVEVDRDATEVRVRVRAAAPHVVPGAVWRVEASVSGPVEMFVAETER